MNTSIKRRIFDAASNGLVSLLHLNHGSKLACAFYEKITPIREVPLSGGKKLVFYCPNELTLWRAETFFTKEPETIEWINGLSPGETLFDIGANVGLYTTYAAKRGLKVFAFEPESQNYAILNKNIYLNGLANQVNALNIAFSDKNGIEALYLPRFIGGGAINNLGEALDWQHKSFSPDYKQAALSFSVDSFVEQYPESFPNHLKVDVDGIEAKIIKGASKTLKDPRFKSLSIEINDDSKDDQETVAYLKSLGLEFVTKVHGEMFNNSKFKNVYNYVFKAKS